ncbi:hypothetical protein J5N97_005286 [Dioscorea zingiberensis]|uniref:Uncharacterized protein n=1 Tax=Dioscorea zingiberensis TaxID=325984 RepID=A0A9D5D7S2_9LILI|nr:hypothetical protein J5N97_005286 [Dioscorea zingiberensis]
MAVGVAPAFSPPLLHLSTRFTPRPEQSRVLVPGVCVVPPLRISNEGFRGTPALSMVVCKKNQLSQQRKCVSHTNRLPSAAMICAATLTKSAAGQTQTVQRPSSTITNTPGKEKSLERPPKLDDGGTGFPPFNFSGGGGGGGGGWKSSGGFFLFALLVFLDYLKELEEEKDARNRRKQLAPEA